MIEVDGEQYYLVDTRHWTFGERRLIPSSLISPAPAGDGREAFTELDVELIRRAPDFNPFRLSDAAHLAALRHHYSDDPGTPRERRIG